MIQTFANRAAARLWDREFVKAFSAVERAAKRKLDMPHNARTIGDLRAPPGNRLEALAGDRRGQYAIRINDQWRICFRWTAEGPEDVEVVDDH
jgi:proteic killer suppression protein